MTTPSSSRWNRRRFVAVIAASAALTTSIVGLSPTAGAAPLDESADMPLSVTPSEADAAAELGAAIESLEASLLSRLPSLFGGVWMEGDTVVVGMAGPSALVNTLADALGLDVVVRSVTAPLSALHSVQGVLDTLVAANGNGIHSSSIDITSGTVRLGVEPGRARLARLAISLLPVARNLVVIEEKPAPITAVGCTTAGGCEPPLRGGVTINAGSGTCSAGFNIQRKTAPKTPSVLTAGHCTKALAGPWTVPTPGLLGLLNENTPIGSSSITNFPNWDFGTIRIDDPGFWQPTGAIHLQPGPSSVDGDELYPIYASRGLPTIGQKICRTGATSGTICGQVISNNVTINYGGQVVRKLSSSTADACQGDSGGPYYEENVGYGVLSGISRNYTMGPAECGFTSYFEQLSSALGILNAELILSPR